jgi:hypothetical protein
MSHTVAVEKHSAVVSGRTAGAGACIIFLSTSFDACPPKAKSLWAMCVECSDWPPNLHIRGSIFAGINYFLHPKRKKWYFCDTSLEKLF